MYSSIFIQSGKWWRQRLSQWRRFTCYNLIKCKLQDCFQGCKKYECLKSVSQLRVKEKPPSTDASLEALAATHTHTHTHTHYLTQVLIIGAVFTACRVCLVRTRQIRFTFEPLHPVRWTRGKFCSAAQQDAHTFHTISSLCPFVLCLLSETWQPPLFLSLYNRSH